MGALQQVFFLVGYRRSELVFRAFLFSLSLFSFLFAAHSRRKGRKEKGMGWHKMDFQGISGSGDFLCVFLLVLFFIFLLCTAIARRTWGTRDSSFSFCRFEAHFPWEGSSIFTFL